MEKTPLREEEIKELEDEIDLAVDRLFVEKRKGAKEPAHQESPIFETEEPPVFETFLQSAQEPPGALRLDEEGRETALPSLESSFGLPVEPGKEELDIEESFAAASPPPSSPPLSYMKAIDQLEAQLLALEWEITDEKLQNTQEAVQSLNQLLKQRNDISSVLGFMDDLLNRMTADKEEIRPPMIKFLLDAKETIKLLLKREAGGEVNIYKQLALEGMEARFAGLQAQKALPSPTAPSKVEKEVIDHPIPGPPPAPPIDWEKVQEMLGQWKTFFGRAEEILAGMGGRLSQLEKVRPESRTPAAAEPPLAPLMDVTIFRACGKCYGVETQKIWKLYRIPPSFREKYGNQPKVRLKDAEVSLVDLRKAFPGETLNESGEAKLLMLQGDGEYKGLIVVEVLKRLRGAVEERPADARPLLGVLHWFDQSEAVEVPILDSNKL